MRFFPLALLIAATLFACDQKQKSTIEPQDPKKPDPIKKPDGTSPDFINAKSVHHFGAVTAVRSARGSRFALVQMHEKKGDPIRSVLLERTAKGEVLERYSSAENEVIIGFDVNEKELCLLRSQPTEVKDPVTKQKYVDLRVQCEGTALGKPIVFHDEKIVLEAKYYGKTGGQLPYVSPKANATVFHARDLQRPFAQLKLVGDNEKILVISGDFGERLYKLKGDSTIDWVQELRPLTEIFVKGGVPQSAPRLAVANGRAIVVGGFVAEEHPILTAHYGKARQIPLGQGNSQGLLVSAWELADKGTLLWQQTLAGKNELTPADVAIGTDGFTILAQLGERGRASWLARLGLDGVERWQRDLTSKNQITRLNAIVERTELIVGGSCRSSEGDDGRVVEGAQGCVLRFTAANGTLTSTKEFGLTRHDAILALEAIEGGKILIGGFINGPIARTSGDGTQTYAWGTW